MQDLELVIRHRIKPIIESSSEKYLGVTIDRLTDDITSRLTKSPLIDIEINTEMPYKEAKKSFKRAFLSKLLTLNLGNISEVARITGKNRRSIHRLIKEFHINIKKIKKDLVKPYEVRLNAMSHLIEHVLDDYRSIMHPKRLQDMYSNVSSISDSIVKELPLPRMSFAAAQREFEERYFRAALKDNNHNIARTAKKIGLRYETLLRKLRSHKMV